MSDADHETNGRNGTVVGAATKLGGRLITALPSGFLSLIMLICFLLWVIRDIQSERIEAMKTFALSCTQALQNSQPGR